MMGHGKQCGAALHSVPLMQGAYILWIVAAPESINKKSPPTIFCGEILTRHYKGD
jgi:hypothetical protein